MLFIMDASGSMDVTKKYLARSYFFVLATFLKRKYNNIAFEFIYHTTVAKRVDEFEFFHKSESGGTYISSGINEALKVMKRSILRQHGIYIAYTQVMEITGLKIMKKQLQR